MTQAHGFLCGPKLKGDDVKELLKAVKEYMDSYGPGFSSTNTASYHALKKALEEFTTIMAEPEEGVK